MIALRQPDRDEAGFSIIEVLGATLVVMVTMLAIIRTQVTSLGLVTTSRDTSVAADDLRSAMESLLALPLDEIPALGSEFEAGLPIVRFMNLHLKDQSITPTYPGYTLGGEVPNPLTIVLTERWTDPDGRRHELVIRTVKTR